MVIPAKRILELNPQYNLISELHERELKPEGLGFDVRAGEFFRMVGTALLGTDTRSTPETVPIKLDEGQWLTLNPAEYVLVRTIETVKLPSEPIEAFAGFPPVLVMLDAFPRTTLQRSGIALLCTKTDPGYKGQLVFGLANVGGLKFRMEIGARVANLVFFAAIGTVNPYKGQWIDGRVSTQGQSEKQI